MQTINVIEVVDVICNIFTALGTMAAVMVALWFSYRDSKPRLQAFATVDVDLQTNTKHLWLSCVNVGKQSIICTGFTFAPNRFSRNGVRLILNAKLDMTRLSTIFPQLMKYSTRAEQRMDMSTLADESCKKYLSSYKWWAAIQLRFFWRVVAMTNIKEFKGKLSPTLINEILAIKFPDFNPECFEYL